MILNRGDVPNIFPNDERLEIIEKVCTITYLLHSPSTIFMCLMLFCLAEDLVQATCVAAVSSDSRPPNSKCLTAIIVFDI